MLVNSNVSLIIWNGHSSGSQNMCQEDPLTGHSKKWVCVQKHLRATGVRDCSLSLQWVLNWPFEPWGNCRETSLGSLFPLIIQRRSDVSCQRFPGQACCSSLITDVVFTLPLGLQKLNLTGSYIMQRRKVLQGFAAGKQTSIACLLLLLALGDWFPDWYSPGTCISPSFRTISRLVIIKESILSAWNCWSGVWEQPHPSIQSFSLLSLHRFCMTCHVCYQHMLGVSRVHVAAVKTALTSAQNPNAFCFGKDVSLRTCFI